MKLILYSKLINPQNKVWLGPLLYLPMGERFALWNLGKTIESLWEHGSPESKVEFVLGTLDSPSWAWSGQWKWGPNTWGGVVSSLLSWGMSIEGDPYFYSSHDCFKSLCLLLLPHCTRGVYFPGSEFPSCRILHGGLSSGCRLKTDFLIYCSQCPFSSSFQVISRLSFSVWYLVFPIAYYSWVTCDCF